MTTGPRTWLATVAVFASLAACDSEAPPPDPSPSTTRTTSPPTSITSTDLANQAPKVRHPLDDKAFVADPCRSLSAPQLAELGLTDPQRNEGDDSFESKDGCAYRIGPTIDMIAYVNYYPDITTGLGEVYAQGTAIPSPSRTPTEIDGYPAVVVTTPEDKTRCHVNVGTSDSTYFEITYYYYDWDDWDGRDTCAAATSIAAAVLANMIAAS